MRKRKKTATTLFTILSLFIAVASCGQLPINTLTSAEKTDGWKLLFDG
ncbi:MAG: DUF1080 domain-containing protein, partial [Chitinophagaceae bacterium]|nr:DUF1080 domain-containing protein [Chitinophagaceae bacterium]